VYILDKRLIKLNTMKKGNNKDNIEKIKQQDLESQKSQEKSH